MSMISKPLITTLSISTLVGFAFFSTFLTAFIIAFVTQFIVYNLFMNAVTVFATLEDKKLENERIKEFSKQGIEVECPCSERVPAFIPFDLSHENIFDCPKCKKACKVILNIDTALVTRPVETVKIDDQLSLRLEEREDNV